MGPSIPISPIHPWKSLYYSSEVIPSLLPKIQNVEIRHKHNQLVIHHAEQPRGGHSIVKNMGGGWLDSLGSGILVGKDILGFYKNIDLDNRG